MYRNLKKKGIAEYDIVEVGDDRILVIEVKNKLDTRMVDRFVNDKLPKFRQAFPEYRDHRLPGVSNLSLKGAFRLNFSERLLQAIFFSESLSTILKIMKKP